MATIREEIASLEASICNYAQERDETDSEHYKQLISRVIEGLQRAVNFRLKLLAAKEQHSLGKLDPTISSMIPFTISSIIFQLARGLKCSLSAGDRVRTATRSSLQQVLWSQTKPHRNRF